MRMRRIIAGTAMLPVLVVGAACSSEPEGSDPTGSETSASVPATPGGSRLTADNVADRLAAAQAAAGSAHLDGKISAGPTGTLTLSGDLRLDKRNPAAHMTMTIPGLGQDMEVILVDQAIYLKAPGLVQDKGWVTMDLSSAPLPGLSSLDTSQVLKGLKSAVEVEAVGTEEVDGVEATHYEVSVDARKSVESLGIPASGAAGQLPAQLAYDIWVDDQDLVRRISLDIREVTVDMRFSAYGEPVDIEAPPPGEVADSSAG